MNIINTTSIGQDPYAQYNQQLANYVFDYDPEAQHGETVGDLATSIGIMGGLTVGAQKLSPIFGKYYDAWKNKTPHQSWSQAMDMAQARYDQKILERDFLNLDKNGNRASRLQRMRNKKLFDRATGYDASIPKMPQTADIGLPSQRAKFRQAYINQERGANCFKKAQQLIDEIKTKKLRGPELKAQLQKIEQAMAKGELRRMTLIKKGIIKPTTIRGKIGAGIRKYTGWNAVKTTALKSKHAGKFMKGLKALKGGFKGSGIFAAIGLAMEAPDIISAFKIGKKEGWKQVGKSTAKTAAGIGGWAAGAAIGQALIPVPGLGALVGGLVGSWLAGKAADKIVGEKSVAEEHAEKQSSLMAQNANESAEYHNELVQGAAQKAQELGDEEMLAMIQDYETQIAQINAAEEQVAEQIPEQQAGTSVNDIYRELFVA